jgi:LPXTG-motif cell wall-anchored protein
MATSGLTITSGNGTSLINFDYTGATTGTNQYLSCTLTDSLGDVAYYGKLADCAAATDADGTFALNLTGVANGTYTLNIFCEQANDNDYTDYAGAAEQYTIQVSGGNGTITLYTATVNLTIDGVAANATSVTLDTTDAGASPVAMTPSGTNGIYTLTSIPGEILHLFVNDVYTGVIVDSANPTANVALYTTSFAAASTGTGTTGPITAAYASTNPVAQNRGVAVSNGSLVVTGSIITFSVAGAAATDTMAWGGGAATSSTPTAATTNVTYSAPTAQVTCTVTAAPVPFVYPVITHFGTWTGSGTAAAKVDLDFTLGKFVKLTLGGVDVSPANYTLSNGSTVITLSESYLKTFANGNYTFRAHFTDGYADLNLTVNVQSGSGLPQTGDGYTALLLFAAALLVLGALSILVGRRKRHCRGTL